MKAWGNAWNTYYCRVSKRIYLGQGGQQLPFHVPDKVIVGNGEAFLKEGEDKRRRQARTHPDLELWYKYLNIDGIVVRIHHDMATPN